MNDISRDGSYGVESEEIYTKTILPVQKTSDQDESLYPLQSCALNTRGLESEARNIAT